MLLRASLVLCAVASHMLAQKPAFTHNVDTSRYGERLICVVPMQGAGTATDPKRPLFMPNFRDPAQRPDPRNASSIHSMRYVLSDDGRFAIVEIVAKDRRGLLPVINHGRNDVVVFERQRPENTKAVIETRVRQFKSDFDLDAFLRPPTPNVARPVAGGVP